MRQPSLITAAALLLSGCTLWPLGTPGDPARQVDRDALAREVTEHERAFADTMARRDLEAFGEFLDEDTVFFAGGDATWRGRAAVIDGWRRYFDGDAAPFSWSPAQVEVLDDGTLALSTGPVLGPGGMQLATFTSVWRRTGPGTWRVVFDKGCAHCACAKGTPAD